MRKIVVLSFISLDGVMQAPGGPEEDPSGGFQYGGWSVPYFDEPAGRLMAEQMSGPFALLLGRRTFDIFAAYWPLHAEDWPGINEAAKYVVSKTLTSHEWSDTHFLNGDVAALRDLKAGDGPTLQVHGSGNLIQTLLKHDLVDALWLKTCPITLGLGKRLFEGGTMPATFTLETSTITPSGVIFANYKRAGELRTGSF
jgi:dihydrofolate reductase